MRITSVFLVLCIGGSVIACEDAGAVRRVEFDVSVRGTPRADSGPLRFITPSGWDVTLDEAWVSIGPIYARNAPPSIGTAPDSGRITTEVLEVTTVDGLDPTSIDLGSIGLAVTERALAAEVRLTEADDGPIAERAGPGRAAVWLRGTATRIDQKISFEGPLVFPAPTAGQEYAWFLAHLVRRIPIDFTPRRGGRLFVTVDVSHWLDDVSFDQLPESRRGGRHFDADIARTQLRNGLSRAGSFRFAWQDPR